MNAIEISGLSKAYKQFKLDGISLTLPGGCIMGLIGENGAGKSTTIHLILEMLRKDSGSVKVLGKTGCDVQTKQELGVVLDNPGLPSLLNAVQIGRVMGGIYAKWDDARFTDCLKRLKVPENQVFYKMSNGTKMKLALAVALSHNAKLLILDEATNGVDPIVRDDIMDMLREFVCDEEHAVLISSHIVSDLEKVCDYIAFLHDGKLLLCMEKDRIQEEYGMLRCKESELRALPKEAICGSRLNAYGAEAIVKRSMMPANVLLGPVDVEQLFIMLAQEVK